MSKLELEGKVYYPSNLEKDKRPLLFEEKIESDVFEVEEKKSSRKMFLKKCIQCNILLSMFILKFFNYIDG